MPLLIKCIFILALGQYISTPCTLHIRLYKRTLVQHHYSNSQRSPFNLKIQYYNTKISFTGITENDVKSYPLFSNIWSYKSKDVTIPIHYTINCLEHSHIFQLDLDQYCMIKMKIKI